MPATNVAKVHARRKRQEQRRKEREAEDSKKRRQRRRSSAAEVDKNKVKEALSEEADADSSVERSRSPSKQKSRRRRKKRPSDDGEKSDVEGDNETKSMLDTIKEKRRENAVNGEGGNNDGGSRRLSFRKRVSMSGSTIARDVGKTKDGDEGGGGTLSNLDVAMGKMPGRGAAEGGRRGGRVSFDAGDDGADGADASRNRSALRSSRFGRSVANDDDDDDNDKVYEDAPLPQEDGLTEDTDDMPPKWTPGKRRRNRADKPPARFRRSAEGNAKGPEPDTFESALQGSLTVRSASSRQGSWKGAQFGSLGSPSGLKPAPILARASTEGDATKRERPPVRFRRSTGTAEELQGTANVVQSSMNAGRRAGIKRRETMGSFRSSRSSTDLGGGGSADGDRPRADARAGILGSLKSTANFSMNREEEMRRIEMMAEDQTFVPPKSRESNVLEAMGHLMSGRLIDLTLWTYSAGFLKVMLFFLLVYVLNIFMWAAVMDAVDLASGGRCVHYDETLTRSERYEFVFEMSWATFTTVGYGTIGPKGDETGCYAIRFCCAFVAFIGVLFAATTAAIMYSKLMRLLAKAHVTFSSTLCVQYGKGNEGSTVRFGQLNFRASVAPAALMKQFSASDLLIDDEEDESPSGSEDGFPVIEFRMINDRANHDGSEIWDAQIRAIVQLNKEQQTSEGGGGNGLSARDKATGGESSLDLEKKVYYPLSLSPDTHPHFSRIWYARHVLNSESPLLKREVRDLIVKDGGKWDKDFNTWNEIRDCLNEFISLRITLSGTSAVSASDVYGEHVYTFDDVCVGWRFANMVYEKKERAHKRWWRKLRDDEREKRESGDGAGGGTIDMDTRTKIDAALLHDIVPQPGGDHEPLDETTNSSKRMAAKSLINKVFTRYSGENKVLVVESEEGEGDSDGENRIT